MVVRMTDQTTTETTGPDRTTPGPVHQDRTGPQGDQTTEQTGPDQPKRSTWPLVIALVGIAAVWVCGAVWSFSEQTDFARATHFDIPQLLPLVLDGLAFSMAAVAWSASIDGRTAGFARLGATIAIAISAASNAQWAWERSGDRTTVIIAAVVPLASNLAFEVLLAETRRQVRQRAGHSAPVPIPAPRLIRLGLSPFATFFAWRRLVLAATDPAIVFRSIAAANGIALGHANRTSGPDGFGTIEPDRTSDKAGSDTGPNRRADQTSPVHAEQTGPDRTNEAPKVDQSAPAKTGPVRTRRAPQTGQTGPFAGRRLHPVRTGRMTVADRVAELHRRYPDRIPGRNEAMRDLGWTGADQTSKALEQLRAERGRTDAGPDDEEQSA